MISLTGIDGRPRWVNERWIQSMESVPVATWVKTPPGIRPRQYGGSRWCTRLWFGGGTGRGRIEVWETPEKIVLMICPDPKEPIVERSPL